MKRRMIDGGIWANDKFARLPYPARLLLMGIVNLADDQGRLIAHPVYLRSQIFPYDDIATGDICQWLKLLTENGTFQTYRVGDKDYIQLVNWWEYQSLQFAEPSQYPRPAGWLDRVRYNAKGGAILTCNWITPRGDRCTDTCDQNGAPLGYSPVPSPSIPPDNPPGLPPETPGDNPPEGTNKDQYNTNKDQGKGDEDDPHAREPLDDAWQEHYHEDIPGNLRPRMEKLVTECGPEAVAYAIHASKDADARNFRYIAQCARNYIPPAPAIHTNGAYHVDIPGVVVMPPVEKPSPVALPPPMAHDDDWAAALAEILPTLTPHPAEWLKGSSLRESGELAGVPLYRVIARTEPSNIAWLNQKVEPLIRKTLSSILRKRILVEIVAQVPEPEIAAAEVTP